MPHIGIQPPPHRVMHTAIPFLLLCAAILLPQMCSAVTYMVTNGFEQNNQNYKEKTILNLQGLDNVREVTSVATVSNGKVNAELKISGMDNNAPETFATGLFMTVSNCHISGSNWIWIEFLPPNAYIHLYKTTAANKAQSRTIAIQTGWEYNTTVFVEDTDIDHITTVHAVRIFRPPAPTAHEFVDNCVMHVRNMKVSGKSGNSGVLAVADSPLPIKQQSALVFEDIQCVKCTDSVLSLKEFSLYDHSAFIMRDVINSHTNKGVVPFLKADTIFVDETSVISFVDINTANDFKDTTSNAIDVNKIDGPGTIVFSRWLMQSSGLTTLQPVNNANFWVSARTSATTDLTPQQLRDTHKFNVNMDNTYKWDGTGKDGACVPVGGGIPDRATYKPVAGKCVAACDAGYVSPACTAPATSQCQVPNCDLCYRITKTKCFVCAPHTTHEKDDTVCRCPIGDCRACPTATECTQCHEGYNVSTSGNSCIRCSIDVPKCVHCSTASKCDECEPYYNVSTDQKTCYDCRIDNCLSCSADKVCSECEPQYNLTNPGKPNNRCMPCLLDNCVLCGSDNNCQQCADGYTKPAGGTGDCVPCNVKHCKRCDTANECAQCPDKHTPEGTQHCHPCTMPGCLSCDGDEKCTDCEEEYTLVGSTCIRCSIDVTNCKECTTDGVCDQCVDYYNVSTDQRKCHDCRIDNCLSCSADKVCAECEGDYNISTDKKTCLDCRIDNCISCSADNVCGECLPQYNLTNPGTTNSRCMPCLLENCVLCGNDNNCQQCAGGSTKPAGGIGDCVPCNVKHCERCDTANKCAQCPDKHTPVDGKYCYPCTMPGCTSCYGDEQCKNCADGYTLVGSTCIRCSIDVTHCKECTTDGVCDQCVDYYNVSTDQKKCYDCRIDKCLSCSADKVCGECLPKYNLTNPGTTTSRCMPCLLDNCILCGSDNNCQQCAGGSTKPAGGTGDCVSCNVKHCERCDAANECAQCPDKHTPEGTQHCHPCTMPGCLSCSGDEQCKDCGPGYTLFQKKCVECRIDGCSQCRDDGVCSICQDGLSLSANGDECISCSIGNCTVCGATHRCDVCACGMVPADDGAACVDCAINNCRFCDAEEDGRECAECIDGYDVSNRGACVKSGLPPWVVFVIVVAITAVAVSLFSLGVFLYLRHQVRSIEMERDAEERRMNRQAKGRGARQHMDIGILDLGDIEGAASGVRDTAHNAHIIRVV